MSSHEDLAVLPLVAGDQGPLRARRLPGGHRGRPLVVAPMTALTAPPRRWRWPAAESTPRRARRVIRRALTTWGLDGLTDDAVLMASELVANACRYGGGPVSVVLRRFGQGIWCEVGDPEPVFPLKASIPPEHGLGIVTTLAQDVWVAAGKDGGKRVCFILAGQEPG